MTKLFFDLQSTHNPHRWFLPLNPQLCVGALDNLFMFGGVGLGAAIVCLERTCARPVIWATAQYLSYARPNEVVDLDVHAPVEGRFTTQARVIGHVGDKEIFTVNAALGARPSEVSHQWAIMPVVPPPEDCPETPNWRGKEGTVHGRLEVRMAHGRSVPQLDEGLSEDGRLCLWIRSRDGVTVDAHSLAIMADFVPAGMANAIGRGAFGNSLDNTIRFRRIVPTEWVLCDIQVQAVHDGFGHGDMRLFAQDGELMAIASQSIIIRMRK